MTQDEIIKNLTKLLELQTKSEEVAIDMIRVAVLAEREACAKVCEEVANRYKTGTDLEHKLQQVGFFSAERCSYDIRARGDK